MKWILASMNLVLVGSVALLVEASLVSGCSSANTGTGTGSGSGSGSSSGGVGSSSGGVGSSSGAGSSGGSSGSSSGGASSSGAGSSSGSSSSSGSGSSGGHSDGGSGGGACTSGAALKTLPACANPAASSLAVAAGCAPTVDGTYHAGEWDDAACTSVGSDPVYVKYSGSTLYLAWSVTPSCGCGMQIVFNTDGAQTLDGSQIDLSVFDDPFSATGDSAEFTSQGGSWTMSSSVAAGIVIANPPNQPTPVTYEIAIPLSQLGVTPGTAHVIGFAIDHQDSATWPTPITTASGTDQPNTPSEWGKLTSAANWE